MTMNMIYTGVTMTELTTVKENEVAVAEDYKQLAINYLKHTGAKCTDNQLAQFIDVCCAWKLDPTKKEVYAVPYGDKFNVLIGYEVYIKRAEASGRLAGWKVWTEGSGNDLVAKIEIRRKDWQEPFVHEVYFAEYNQNTPIWKSKPRTMIKKVAIAQGFRLAFPDVLGGMPYTADELPAEMTGEKVINITPIAEAAVKPATISSELSDLRNHFFTILKQAGAIPIIDAAIESNDEIQMQEVLIRTKDYLINNKYM